MGIGVFTAVVLFAGINMTVVVVFEVILSTCIFHDHSPRFMGCALLFSLENKLAMEDALATREEWGKNNGQKP
jgi:hypothetical protein